jgi:bla regulator protein blaR1
MNLDLCLVLYGLVAALMAPYLLRRFQAGQRLPLLAVAGWLMAAASLPASWLLAALSLAGHPGRVLPVLGMLAAAGVAGRLAWVTTRTWAATRTRRVRHTEAASMVGRHDPGLNAVVVDFPDPLVYCLPAPRGGLVVVSTGARARLSRQQLRAVIAHEREHLDGRHHQLLTAAEILSRFVPRVGVFGSLRQEVGDLLEMRADDVAARKYGHRTVAAAIAAMAGARAPSGALGAGGSMALARAGRLLGRERASRADKLWLVAVAFVLTFSPVLATLAPCPRPW